jgi:serine acetyltransferase
MLRTTLRNIELIHTLYESLIMIYKRKKYRLKHVHKTFIMDGKSWISRDLIAHEYSFIGVECLIGPKVELGPYVMLGPRVAIVGADHRYDIAGTPMIFSGRPVLKKTVIESDAWVGYGAILMAGITVGRGSIIAAGAVVTKDVPPYQIYGGIPARKLAERFASASDREEHDKMLARRPSKGKYAPPHLVE